MIEDPEIAEDSENVDDELFDITEYPNATAEPLTTEEPELPDVFAEDIGVGEIVEIEMPERSIAINVAYDAERVRIGSRVTLSAVLTGYDGLDYSLVWERAKVDDNGIIISKWQETDISATEFSYIFTESNYMYAWRLRVTIVN